MATYSRKIGSVSSHYLYQPGSYADATINVYLDVTYTQNATNNTTSTYARIRVTNSNTSVPYQITSWSITGTGSTGSGSDSTMSTYSATRNLTATSTKTINHGTDGTCTFTNGATVKIKYYSGTGTSTTTSTLTLSSAVYTMPTIEVHSTLSFSTTTPTMGNSVTMTITKASCATSGVRIQATYDGTTTTIYEGTGASYAWTVPDLASTTTDALTKAITITIQSKKSSTYYEATTYTLTASVPSTYVPSVSIGTVTDNLSAITPFVIGYSKLTIPLTGSVSSDGGATIVSYAIEVRETNSSGTVLYSASTSNTGTSQSYTMTSVITTATTYIKATITDSRGRTATASTTKSASSYSKPTISVTGIRCDSGGTASQFGTYTKATCTWSITNLTGNRVTQSIKIWMSTDGSNYTAIKSQSVSSGTYSGTFNQITALAINQQAWIFAEIYDELSGRVVSPTITVAKATMPLSLYDDGTNVGVTVGQIASGANFSVTLPTTHTDMLYTSYRSAVAMGSYGTDRVTIDDFVAQVRFSNGCMGSFSCNTAYTKNGITIPTGWYNFIYSPHRNGGINGNANGDNCNYGNLLLMGMNNTNGIFRVRISSSAVAQVECLTPTPTKYTDFTNNDTTKYRLNGTAGTNYFYVVYGSMVFVTFNVYCVSATQWPSVRSFKGLPAPLLNGADAVFVPLADQAVGGNSMISAIQSDGTVQCTGGTTGHYYYGTGMYIKA